MHKKISIGLTITISAIAIIVTALVTTAVTMNIFSSLVSDLPQRESMYASLAEIDNLIRNEYYGSVDDDSLNSSLADGYLSNLTTGTSISMISAADFMLILSVFLTSIIIPDTLSFLRFVRASENSSGVLSVKSLIFIYPAFESML